MSNTERRSFVTMDDGTEVDILYYKMFGNIVMFTTKNGMYIYRPRYLNGLGFDWQFYVLSSDKNGEINTITAGKIRNITLDERAEYKVIIPGYETITVLANPDAKASEIGLAVLNELDIIWERMS